MNSKKAEEVEMSNGAQTPERTGLHPLAWVGIGCGVLLVIVITVLMVGGFFLARTVQNVAEDFEDNPGLAAAKFIVKASPDLEEVETDEDAGTMTIRNTKTGEIITVNFDDINEGRFSWTADGEEMTIDVSDAEDGTVKIESSDGDGFALTTGSAVNEEIPDWLPVYPGSEPTNRGTMKTNDSVNGNFTLSTDDAVAEVLEFYREQLKSEGFQVTVNTYSGGDNEGAMINSVHEAENRSVIVVIGSDDGSTTVNLTYSSKK
jgi:hypothetical protein